jgi:hypothetical protein
VRALGVGHTSADVVRGTHALLVVIRSEQGGHCHHRVAVVSAGIVEVVRWRDGTSSRLTSRRHMVKKLLALVVGLTSVLVLGTAAPAQASCPPAGCVLDVASVTTSFTYSNVTVWLRIDYTNHKVRPYARVDAKPGYTFAKVDPGNTILYAAGFAVLNSNTPYNGASTTSVTFTTTAVYTCPVSARNYVGEFAFNVYTSGATDSGSAMSGTAATTCGW